MTLGKEKHQPACYSQIGSGYSQQHLNHSGGLNITTVGFFAELYSNFFPEGSLPCVLCLRRQ